MKPTFSLRQKAGRMFLTGFLGEHMTREMAELIERHFVGNFVFFDQRNIQTAAQLSRLVSDIRERCLKSSGLPPFIAVDNEGGVNSQLLSVGTVFPGNLALAAGGDPRQAGLEGRAIAREVRAVGLSANFAPVLDLYDGANPGIGVRCFGERPETVAAYALTYLRAHQREGIVNVGKHFPGLSVTDTDPHHAMPRIQRSLRKMWDLDLAPYRALFAAGLPAVMTAHAVYPALDRRFPATLSWKILTGLLRQKMGFTGVVLTDDLEMPAIEKEHGIEGAAELAIRAGADMVMVCHTFEKMKRAVEHVVQTAERDPKFAARIEESFERVEALVSRVPAEPPSSSQRAFLRSHSHQRLAEKQARRSVTLVRDREGLLPLRLGEGQRVGVVYPLHTMYGWNQPVRLDLAFIKVLGPGKVRGEMFDPRTPGESEKRVLKLAGETDLLVVGTYDAQFSDSQAEMVRKLQATGKPLVVAATRSPQDLVRFPQAGTYVVSYNFYPVSLDAVARAVCG